jgi:hypothetical protein
MTGLVLLLQGIEGPSCLPAQDGRRRDAQVAAGVPCDLRFFEGMAHGFRSAETACLEAA